MSNLTGTRTFSLIRLMMMRPLQMWSGTLIPGGRGFMTASRLQNSLFGAESARAPQPRLCCCCSPAAYLAAHSASLATLFEALQIALLAAHATAHRTCTPLCISVCTLGCTPGCSPRCTFGCTIGFAAFSAGLMSNQISLLSHTQAAPLPRCDP